MNFFKNLKIRWKLLGVVLPLVVVPIFLVGLIVGYVSKQQAYLGITQTSKADLDHMAEFTLDLFNAHHQQFEVYKADKRQVINEELAALIELSYNLVAAQHSLYRNDALDLTVAKSAARQALREVNIGETGYIYAMTSRGDLAVHVASEGDNVYTAQDENGRYFIQQMIKTAKAGQPGDRHYISYPWRNPVLGDTQPRQKIVAYTYFEPWDWIIAAGSYLDESYEDLAFEQEALADLKARILSKRVGETGYIYAMNTKGDLTIHPFRVGQNIYDEQDQDGHYFIREMIERQHGWIRYPWQNETDPRPRMKIVRYQYFEPWDWIVAVGSYEDEFYRPANEIGKKILISVLLLTGALGVMSVGLVFFASRVLTKPIGNLIAGIRDVKQGRLDTQLPVYSNDELGELARDFNHMTDVLRQNKELEANLAQQAKMASIGVLSSGVAHEINNPLGVILGYASYLEGKIDPAESHYQYIQEIKQESKRCKNIVQDLLSYARVPKPALQETDINALLDQIVDFAANHTDLDHITVQKAFDPTLPTVLVDPDQLRQVAINLMLNAGAAMKDGGQLRVSTAPGEGGHVKLIIQDNGSGIAPEDLEKIFEPFFTTKTRGTGLGLAITKTIIDQHHGAISMDSTVGQGTTVTIDLPGLKESAH